MLDNLPLFLHKYGYPSIAVFLFLEAVRGKPLALKHREMAQAVGMMLILTLMVFVFYHDLVRLFTSRQ